MKGKAFFGLLVKGFLSNGAGADLRKRIFTGTIWTAVGTALTKSISIVMSFVLARILGKEGFGEYGVINNTVLMVSVIGGLGLGSTVTRYVSNLRNREPLRAGRIIYLTGLITVISTFFLLGGFIFLAPWISRVALAAPHLNSLLQISSLVIAFNILNGVQNAVLNGLEEFKSLSILSAVIGIVQSVLVVILAFFYGILGVVWGLVIASGLSFVLFNLVIRKKLKTEVLQVTSHGFFREWRILVKYSLPSFLSILTVGPVIWLSNTLLVKKPNGYGELGVLNAAMQWDGFLNFLPGLMSTVLLPIMSGLYGDGNRADSVRVMWKMVKISAVLIVPLVILVAALSRLIMNAYGRDFGDGYKVLIVVAISTVFSSLAVHFGTFIMASGRMWYGFALNAIWAVIFLMLSHFLVFYGALGLASARLVSYLLHFLFSYLLTLYLIKTLKHG